jgi:hypothetical protein
VRVFIFSILCLFNFNAAIFGQTLKGFISDSQSGLPIPFVQILCSDSTILSADIDGVFFITNENVNSVELTALGYASKFYQIENKTSEWIQWTMDPAAINIQEIVISEEVSLRKNETLLMTKYLRAKDLREIPGFGGSIDVIQLLSQNASVNSAGSQGGRLFLHGGTSEQSGFELDGISLFSPVHSLSNFSVFPGSILQSAKYHSAMTDVELGSRTNTYFQMETTPIKKKLSGDVSIGSVSSEVALHLPFYVNNSQRTGLVLHAKTSMFDKFPGLYSSLNDENVFNSKFTDLYGKIEHIFDNGSSVSVVLFDFNDEAQINSGNTSWDNLGVGINFDLLPSKNLFSSKGSISYSDYSTIYTPAGIDPQMSGIEEIKGGLDFVYYPNDDQLKYGFEIKGQKSIFHYVNQEDITIDKVDNSTELSGYIHYLINGDNFLLDPGVRFHYYATLGEISIEPRISAKYILSNSLRVKAGVGVTSQNLISFLSDRDIVNIFVGYLASPGGSIRDFEDQRITSFLSKSTHYSIGIEWDPAPNVFVDANYYLKDFFQQFDLNRSKSSISESDFIFSTGKSSGAELGLKYSFSRGNFKLSYAYSQAERNNGNQTYSASFEKQHQLSSSLFYTLDADRRIQFALAFYFSTGSPFTRTQGFFGDYDILTENDDFITQNPNLKILYEDLINMGRLPNTHRLDFSVNKFWNISDDYILRAQFSVHNLYDRNNIFYFDRIEGKRVDQLGVIPGVSLGLEF